VNDVTGVAIMENLTLHVAGATPAELERGLAAACAYFEAAGVDPVDVYGALSEVLDEDAGKINLDEVSEHAWEIWHHWEEAELAAATACGRRQDVQPRCWLEYLALRAAG
jgi:hypothetical protein